MSKQVKVNSFQHQLFVELEDGKRVDIKEIDNPTDYGKDVTIFTKDAVKGVKKGSTLYAVSVADYIPKKRVSTKETILSMLASGMSAEEVVAHFKEG